MADENNQGGTGEQNSAGTSQEGSNNQENQSADSGQENKGTEAKPNEEGSKETQKSSEVQNQDKSGEQAKTDNEPPVRKTKVDYILERQQKKAERDRAKAENNSSSEQQDNEEELTPAEEAKLEKFISRKYGKQLTAAEQALETSTLNTINQEISDFLTNDPNGKYFKEFESKIRVWAVHPSRSHLPIKTIAYEVAGDKMLQIGAQMAKEAAKEASESKAGGSGARATEGGGQKKVWEMTNEEFAKMQQGVMQRQA